MRRGPREFWRSFREKSPRSLKAALFSRKLTRTAGLLSFLGERPGMSAEVVAAGSDELVSVLEQLPEGVFVLDGEQRIIFGNKPGFRLIKLKAKTSLGQPFPYPLEDGTMRDFDVEMLVKSITWAGLEANLVHLKPLKSAGAFHLEWKLESALEKARSAEVMLEEWKSREEMPAVDHAGSTELEKTRDQLAAAIAREAELSGRLDEYQQMIAHQREEFDERLSELESLLEMAETRADELQSEVVTGDHQTAAELQHAVSLAREAEDQIRALEGELSEARNRVRVAEEQAEVAEERAYGLEAELEKLSSEASEISSEELEALQQELATLKEQAERWEKEAAEWRAQAEQSIAALQAQSEGAESRERENDNLARAREIEVVELAERLASRDEELAILTDRVEAKEDELASVLSKLQEREQELTSHGGRSAAKDEELSRLTDQLSQRETELIELTERLSQKEEELSGLKAENSQLLSRLEAQSGDTQSLGHDIEHLRQELETARQEAQERESALEAELDAMRGKLETAEETLRVRSEESDELAEQLRAETEESEELVAQLREENDRLGELMREQVEELESLREIAADAESMLVEFDELRQAHEELLSQSSAGEAASLEAEELRGRLAELEPVAAEAERLQKEVQKLVAQLDEAGAQAEKGEKAEKLERKLEGALRRAEEAEERLIEERRLLAELRQTSERRIGELENRQSASGPVDHDPETERLAFQDPLTGLPNRNILHRYLGFMLKQSVRYDRYTALLRIDCDNFKTISDTFGSEVGDRLIRLLGERLSAVVRSSDVLGRLGEDEFAILLSELSDQKEASVVTASVIKRIYQMLKKPFAIEDQNISINVSIGVSLYPLDAANGEQMMQHSGVALKRAKETGRGQAQYFTPEVQSTHEARMQLDHELKLGLERGEFGLLYQPIFDLSNGQVVGVEALIRWNHPRLGSIGPDEFLKVAEESGIIVLIGNWAMRAALQRAAQWQQAGLGLFVSLNLSRRQLLQADLVPLVHSTLAEFRCSADRVLLEITEELSGPELPRLRDTLASLQQVGVRLAVDNFGTSASSLQELRRGPFQVLKIDRRFVRGVPAHEENAGIVMSALTMGHHLSRITVAVGVETEAEKNWLAKTGCRFAQGNLLSPPLQPEQVADIVSRR